MSAIWFGNIKAETEGGIVFSGDPRSVIDGITLKDSSISLKKLTDSRGGFRDFRPADMPVEDDFNIPIIYLEYANHVTLNNTQVPIDLCSAALLSTGKASYEVLSLIMYESAILPPVLEIWPW